MLDEEDSIDLQQKYYLPNLEKKTFDNAAADQAQKMVMTYGVGFIKFIPMGLKDHFRDVWNMLDVLIVILSTIGVVMWLRIITVHSYYFSNRNVQVIDPSVDLDSLNVEQFEADLLVKIQQYDVYRVAYWLSLYQRLQSILIFLVIVKCLSEIEKFNKKIGMLFDVLQMAKNEMISMLLIAFLILETFDIGFAVSFGSYFSKFQSHNQSNIELLRLLLGDTEFMDQVTTPFPLLAGALKGTFLFIMNFIFLNLIRALISHSFVTITRQSMKVLTVEEQLQEKHWTVKLMEYKDPIVNSVRAWVEAAR